MGAKTSKILRIIGYTICGLMLVMGAITAFFAVKTRVLPASYIIIFSVALVLIDAGFIYAQRWKIAGVVTKTIAVLLVLLLLVSITYLHYTYVKLREMSGINTQIDTIQFLVPVDDGAENLLDARDYSFGILRDMDRENTDLVLEETKEELGQSLACQEYDWVYDMVDALLAGEIDGMILNSAYMGILTDTEGYQDFSGKVKSIGFHDVETKMENDDFDVPEDYLYGGEHVFSVYISGSDQEGKPSANDRSDVNILMTVNMDTRQILLISTPRDYYVPISIAEGQNDKLTHTGIYGVDCSRDTLGKLYNLNIDHYLKVNFTGFEQVIDAVGGITVYSEVDFYIDDVVFNKGYNECNGREALLFTRERHLFVDGDRQRGRNQMAVIEAVVDKLTSANAVVNYKEILDEISDCIVTSMTYDEIADLIRFQLSDMRGWDVLKYSVSGTDSMAYTYSWPREELYVMEPDYDTVETAREYLRKMYKGERITVEEQHAPTEETQAQH